jgi:hypothetical protein
MGKLLWSVGALAACAGLAVGSVAAAAPPVTTPVPFQETFPGFTGACDFPITVTFNTQQTMREWKSADGTVLQMFVTGKGSVNLVNEENDRSITVNASGPTLSKKGGTKGTGNWVFIGTDAQADFLPFPPGAWQYSGRIGNLDAADYSKVFSGSITDLCAAIS